MEHIMDETRIAAAVRRIAVSLQLGPRHRAAA